MDKTYIENMPMSAPGLAIVTAGSPQALIGTDFKYKIDGEVYFSSTPGNAGLLPSFAGLTVADGFTVVATLLLSKSNVYSWIYSTAVANSTLVDANGNAVVIPTGSLPDQQAVGGFCVVGFAIINNASGSTFTGGTTALDATDITSVFIDNFGYGGN